MPIAYCPLPIANTPSTSLPTPSELCARLPAHPLLALEVAVLSFREGAFAAEDVAVGELGEEKSVVVGRVTPLFTGGKASRIRHFGALRKGELLCARQGFGGGSVGHLCGKTARRVGDVLRADIVEVIREGEAVAEFPAEAVYFIISKEDTDTRRYGELPIVVSHAFRLERAEINHFPVKRFQLPVIAGLRIVVKDGRTEESEDAEIRIVEAAATRVVVVKERKLSAKAEFGNIVSETEVACHPRRIEGVFIISADSAVVDSEIDRELGACLVPHECAEHVLRPVELHIVEKIPSCLFLPADFTEVVRGAQRYAHIPSVLPESLRNREECNKNKAEAHIKHSGKYRKITSITRSDIQGAFVCSAPFCLLHRAEKVTV